MRAARAAQPVRARDLIARQSGSEIVHAWALGQESVVVRCENRLHGRAIAHGCAKGQPRNYPGCWFIGDRSKARAHLGRVLACVAELELGDVALVLAHPQALGARSSCKGNRPGVVQGARTGMHHAMQSYRWLARLALATTSCLPLQDLSSYDGASLGAGGNAPGGSLGGGGGDTNGAGAGLAGSVGSAGATGEGPDGETPLVPGNAGGGPNDPPCVGSVCSADGGLSFDASAPLPPEPAVDASPPLLGCALDEQRGPNGNCYVLAATLLAWPDARAGCQARGSGWDLATVRSADDSAFLLTLFTGEAWLGGSDSTTEGTWAWVTDGAEFWLGDGATGNALNGAFVNWFTDEPNGEDSSDCLRALATATWADLECTELRSSVCEGPSESSLVP